MQCSGCAHENRPGRKFCVNCGAALERRCPQCNATCEPDEKFCGECGTALGSTPEVAAGFKPASGRVEPDATEQGKIDFAERDLLVIHSLRGDEIANQPE